MSHNMPILIKQESISQRDADKELVQYWNNINPVTLKKRINRFKSNLPQLVKSNNVNYIHKYIKDNIFFKYVLIPERVKTLPFYTNLYRTRILHNKEELNDAINNKWAEHEIWYRSNNAPIGRLNNSGQSIFYLSMDKNTCVKEAIAHNISSGYIIRSKFKVTHPLKLTVIGSNDINDILNVFRLKNINISGNAIKVGKLYNNFLRNLFNNYNGNEYLIPITLGFWLYNESNHSNIDITDGWMYNSVQTGGYNIALKLLSHNNNSPLINDYVLWNNSKLYKFNNGALKSYCKDVSFSDVPTIKSKFKGSVYRSNFDYKIVYYRHLIHLLCNDKLSINKIRNLLADHFIIFMPKNIKDEMKDLLTYIKNSPSNNPDLNSVIKIVKVLKNKNPKRYDPIYTKMSRYKRNINNKFINIIKQVIKIINCEYIEYTVSPNITKKRINKLNKKRF